MDTAAFEKNIAEFCGRRDLISSGDGVLVALSGGGDSVALLYVLLALKKQLKISTIEAAHLNHNIRGEDSLRDEEFVSEICDELVIPLSIKRMEQGEIPAADGSIETASREMRLSFLEKTAKERGLTKIATGHTMDDQAETVLFRLLRGTGPSGLAGIPAKRDMWVRPLLEAERAQLREYLTIAGISWCEDDTNEDVDFTRNRIRHELIPYLEKTFNSGVCESIVRLAGLMHTQEDYIENETSKALGNVCIHADKNKILLDIEVLKSYHTVIQQRLIRHALATLEGVGRDTDRHEVEQVLGLISENKKEKKTITPQILCEVAINTNTLVFVRPPEPMKPQPITVPGEIMLPDSGGCIVTAIEKGCRIKNTRNESTDKAERTEAVVLDTDVVDEYGPISVGSLLDGDYITTSRKQGKREKVRNLFSRLNIPESIRDTLPAVRAGAVIVWIPGVAQSNAVVPKDEIADTKEYYYLMARDYSFHWHGTQNLDKQR